MRNKTASNAAEVLFLLFVLAYAGLIVWNAAIQTPDEMRYLESIEIGEGTGAIRADHASMCRFVPFYGEDLLLLKMLGASQHAYYVYNALLFCLFAGFFAAFLDRFAGSPGRNRIVVAALCLTSGMAAQWFVLSHYVRFISLLLAVFLWTFTAYEERGRKGLLTAGFLCLGLACYQTKESFFSVALIFAGLALFWGRGRFDRAQRAGFWFTLAACLAYAALYLHFGRTEGCVSYTGGARFSLAGTVTAFAAYLASDPFVVLVYLPLALWRGWTILRRGGADPFLDALMLASLPYMLFFVVGGLSTRYYFTPLYVIVIPVLLKHAPWRDSRLFKGLTAAACAIFALNVLPGGVAAIAAVKNQQAVYSRAMDFVAGRVQNVSPDRPASIVLFGGHVRNVRTWLGYRGLPVDRWIVENRRDAVLAKPGELDSLAREHDVAIIARDSALALHPDLVEALAGRFGASEAFEDPFPVGDVSLVNLARMAAFRLQQSGDGRGAGRYYPLSGIAGYLVLFKK